MLGVILSGGSGTRFWPKSRHKKPKQLIKILPDNELTMIELTTERISQTIDNIYVVTNKDHLYETNKILGHKIKATIAEPAGRNTAAAIGLAALLLNDIAPDEIMAVFPADHVILDQEAFNSSLLAAKKCAEEGYLVTFGIKPSYPETGYGYIQTDKDTIGNLPCYKVASFKEKPDLETAKEYLLAKTFFWNSGMFVWKISNIIEELDKYLPKMMSELRIIVDQIGHNYDLSHLEEEYLNLESTSIDYGVMERSNKVLVLPVDLRWNDVGSWSALDDIVKNKDQSRNIIKGNVLTLDTENTTIESNSRLVATIGLKDLIIVETADAVLVCHKDQAQDVKKIVEKLKSENRNEYL